MASPVRQRIIEAIRARLELIEVANGFVTDAGKALYLGETPQLSPDDPDKAIAIVVGDDEVGYTGENLFITLPLNIQALAKVDLDEPWIAIEQVIGDIKTAIELEDRTLGGLVRRMIHRGSTRTIERQPGATTVGVSVQYRAPFQERWGAP